MIEQPETWKISHGVRTPTAATKLVHIARIHRYSRLGRKSEIINILYTHLYNIL